MIKHIWLLLPLSCFYKTVGADDVSDRYNVLQFAQVFYAHCPEDARVYNPVVTRPLIIDREKNPFILVDRSQSSKKWPFKEEDELTRLSDKVVVLYAIMLSAANGQQEKLMHLATAFSKTKLSTKLLGQGFKDASGHVKYASMSDPLPGIVEKMRSNIRGYPDSLGAVYTQIIVPVKSTEKGRVISERDFIKQVNKIQLADEMTCKFVADVHCSQSYIWKRSLRACNKFAITPLEKTENNKEFPDCFMLTACSESQLSNKSLSMPFEFTQRMRTEMQRSLLPDRPNYMYAYTREEIGLKAAQRSKKLLHDSVESYKNEVPDAEVILGKPAIIAKPILIVDVAKFLRLKSLEYVSCTHKMPSCTVL